jgi:hypothetical protein
MSPSPWIHSASSRDGLHSPGHSFWKNAVAKNSDKIKAHEPIQQCTLLCILLEELDSVQVQNQVQHPIAVCTETLLQCIAKYRSFSKNVINFRTQLRNLPLYSGLIRHEHGALSTCSVFYTDSWCLLGERLESEDVWVYRRANAVQSGLRQLLTSYV